MSFAKQEFPILLNITLETVVLKNNFLKKLEVRCTILSNMLIWLMRKI